MGDLSPRPELRKEKIHKFNCIIKVTVGKQRTYEKEYLVKYINRKKWKQLNTYIQESIGKAELVKMTKIGNIHGSCRFLRVGTLTYWCQYKFVVWEDSDHF